MNFLNYGRLFYLRTKTQCSFIIQYKKARKYTFTASYNLAVISEIWFSAVNVCRPPPTAHLWLHCLLPLLSCRVSDHDNVSEMEVTSPTACLMFSCLPWSPWSCSGSCWGSSSSGLSMHHSSSYTWWTTVEMRRQVYCKMTLWPQNSYFVRINRLACSRWSHWGNMNQTVVRSCLMWKTEFPLSLWTVQSILCTSEQASMLWIETHICFVLYPRKCHIRRRCCFHSCMFFFRLWSIFCSFVSVCVSVSVCLCVFVWAWGKNWNEATLSRYCPRPNMGPLWHKPLTQTHIHMPEPGPTLGFTSMWSTESYPPPARCRVEGRGCIRAMPRPLTLTVWHRTICLPSKTIVFTHAVCYVVYFKLLQCTGMTCGCACMCACVFVYLSEQTNGISGQKAECHAAVWWCWEKEEPVAMDTRLQVSHSIEVWSETTQ